MTYFRDLSPYTYDDSEQCQGLVNVGWLDVSEPFEKGEVPESFVDSLWERCKRPVMLMRGFHTCNLCPPSAKALGPLRLSRGSDSISLGNGEIRVFGRPQRTYSAPTLIYHYITVHQYRPPDEFVKAVLNEADADSTS
jgi:hypothetical protein